MSALPPKADMCGARDDVRFGPKAEAAARSCVRIARAGLIEAIVDAGAPNVIGHMRRSHEASGKRRDTIEGVINVTEINIKILEFDTPIRRESPLDAGADCPPSLGVAEVGCNRCGRDCE